MELRKKYFKVSGDKVLIILANLELEKKEIEANRTEFMRRHGADMLYMDGLHVRGCCFSYHPIYGIRYMTSLGMKIVTSEDEYYVYIPSERCIDGLKMKADMEKLKGINNNEYINTKFGVHRKIKIEQSDGCMRFNYNTKPYITGDTIVFEIPYLVNEGRPIAGMINIPRELIEITEAEFKGLTQ